MIKNSVIETLSGEYIRGYTKAIQDIIEIFTYIQPDLKHHRKNITAKTSMELLHCCLENRENIRENREGFIRYNGIKSEFEFYKPQKMG